MTFAGAQIDGSVVVVTGGGTGIGAAIAERFAAEGAHVVITGRRKAPLDDVATQIGALAIVADVGVENEVANVIAATLSTFGRIDTLVCNAGGGGFTAVEQTSDRDWADSMHANLTTAFVSARGFLPALK